MRKFGLFIVGKAEEFSFENRLFNAMIFLAFMMTFFGGILDLILIGIITWWFAFSLAWLLFFYASRFKGLFNLSVGISFAVLIFVFFPYAWTNSNGTIGVFPYYAIISIAYVNMVLEGRIRLIMNVSLGLVMSGLFVYDYLFSSYLDMSLIEYNIPQVGIHIFIAMVGMAVLILIYSNTYMKEKRRVEEFSEIIQENFQHQLYYMENLESLNQQLKSERHDFNHHLGVVYGLLESHESSKARDYAHELVSVAESYQRFVYVPYPIIRAMINYKLSIVSDKDIDLKLKVNLAEGLNLNEYDLTIILGNILDNAIEACMLLEDVKPIIEFNLYNKLNYLVIQVKNTTIIKSAIAKDKLQTTKEDPENHGFGLKNIEYLVKKYKGIMNIDQGKDYFMIDIALLIDQ